MKNIWLILCILLISQLFMDQAAALPNVASEFVPTPHYLNKSSLYEQLPIKQGQIVFLGDSITDGNEWNELLNHPNMINRGISGDTTEGVLHRIHHICALRPSKIFILIGTNDLGKGTSIRKIIANYDQIIFTIKQYSPQTIIYVQSIFPVNEKMLRSKRTNHDIILLNRKLEKLAREKQVTYIDVYSSFITKHHQLHPNFSYDGLHLNGLGYLQWKKVLEKYIL